MAQDPVTARATDGGRALFGELAKLARGHTCFDVIDAANALLINAVRGNCAKRYQAEEMFNDFSGRAKQILLDHYDGVTGNRRAIVPYDQHISVPLHVDEDVFPGRG